MIHVLRPATPALLLCAIVACSPSSAGPASSGPEAATIKKRDPARVRVEPAVAREMLRILETTTRVESEHQVEIYARASGPVVEVLAEEGDVVAEGQVLARMDSRELAIAESDAEVALEDARAAAPRLEVAMREAEAKLATAQRGYEQVQRDYARNEAISQSSSGMPALLSLKDLDASRLARDNAQAETKSAELALERARLEREDAKTAVRRAELTLERARLNLANASLKAPFAGVIATRNVKTGDTLALSGSAFTLTDPTNLRAVFYRPQRELAQFAKGLPDSDALAAPLAKGAAEGRAAEIEIFATAEALPGKRFRGAIERVAPTIDPQSGNFRVTARLDGVAQGEKATTLLPGMLVRLEIITERRPGALVVPKRALRREGDVNMVFAVRSEHAERVVVTEGLADGESLQVLPQSGARLEPGDLVVVVGNRDLEDGSEVQIAANGELAVDNRPAVIAGATARTDGKPEASAADKAEPAPAGEPAAHVPADGEPAKQATPPPEQVPAKPAKPAEPAGDGGGH